MEINIEKQENNYGIVKIAIVAADYQEAYEKQLKEYRKKANLKGFRPGQVPMSLVKRMFGKDLKGEIVTNTVNEKLYEYINGEEEVLFVPIQKSEPLTVDEISSKEDFEFEFEVCLVPQIDFKLSKDTAIEGYKITPTEEDVASVIDRIKESNPRTIKGEEVGAEDFVTGNFKQVEGDFESEAMLPMKQVAENAKAIFEGKKVGEVVTFDINEVLPEENQIKNLFTPEEDVLPTIKGDFELTIEEITTQGEPEMDQEFFDTVVGPDKVTNEEEFMEELKKQIADVNQDYANTMLSRDLRDKIMDEVAVSLPEELLKKVLRISQKEEMNDEQVAEKLPSFIESAKWHAITTRIMKNAGITIEEEELEFRAREMTRNQFAKMGLMSIEEEQMNMIIDSVINGKDKGRIMDEAREALTTDKLNDYLLSQVTVMDKEVSLKEFETIVEEINKKVEAAQAAVAEA